MTYVRGGIVEVAGEAGRVGLQEEVPDADDDAMESPAANSY